MYPPAPFLKLRGPLLYKNVSKKQSAREQMSAKGGWALCGPHPPLICNFQQPPFVGLILAYPSLRVILPTSVTLSDIVFTVLSALKIF